MHIKGYSRILVHSKKNFNILYFIAKVLYEDGMHVVMPKNLPASWAAAIGPDAGWEASRTEDMST